MFLFADHQHRTGGGPHYAFGRASNTKVFPTGVTMRGNHDQRIGSLLSSQSSMMRVIRLGSPVFVKACAFLAQAAADQGKGAKAKARGARAGS